MKDAEAAGVPGVEKRTLEQLDLVELDKDEHRGRLIELIIRATPRFFCARTHDDADHARR